MMLDPNTLGHIGYVLLLVGTLLVAKKQTIGWFLRMSGELMWVYVGIVLDLNSIWFWGCLFAGFDLYGFTSWRNQNKRNKK